MILQIYVTLLLAALLLTGGVLKVGATGSVGGMQVSTRMGVVISAAAFLLWGLLAIESFEVVVASAGEQYTYSYPQLAWLAAAGAGIALISLFQASVQEIDNTGGIT